VARRAAAAPGGLGIVYTLTKRDADAVATFLRQHGIAAEPYSGERATEERIAVEDRLLANDLKAVVATSALGMGYDKPDLGFVVHFQAPGRSSPTTSRSAAPAAASTTRRSSCCAAPRTSASRTSSSSRPSRGASTSTACSSSSTPPATRG
jgi:superfamily II DNA/RNA helicase